jgi:hypothetical protein
MLIVVSAADCTDLDRNSRKPKLIFKILSFEQAEGVHSSFDI